jgi:hypothetical protein
MSEARTSASDEGVNMSVRKFFITEDDGDTMTAEVTPESITITYPTGAIASLENHPTKDAYLHTFVDINGKKSRTVIPCLIAFDLPLMMTLLDRVNGNIMNETTISEATVQLKLFEKE